MAQMNVGSLIAFFEPLSDAKFWGFAIPAAVFCLISARMTESVKAQKTQVGQVAEVFLLIFAIGLIIGALVSDGVSGAIIAGLLAFFFYGLGRGWHRPN